MSPRLPLGNIPSAANASSIGTNVNFPSPSNRSRSTTISQSVNKENTTEQLSKRYVADKTSTINKSKTATESGAATTITEGHSNANEIEENEKGRRCDTERVTRLTMMSGATAPSPILNASITAKRLTKQRIAASNLAQAEHQKNEDQSEPDSEVLPVIASSKRASAKQRLHSTYIEEDKMCASPLVAGGNDGRRASRLDKLRESERQNVINSPNQAAFDLSMRRKSGNLSVMTHDVEQLMEGAGPLDPEQDEIVQGSGPMYQAALINAAESAASISSLKQAATNNTASGGTRSASVAKDTAVYDFEPAKNNTKRSTRSASNVDKTSNNPKRPEESEKESNATNRQPSKSSITISKVTQPAQPEEKADSVTPAATPAPADDVFVQPEMPPPSLPASSQHHNNTQSVSMISQGSQRSSSSQPIRDEIDVSVAKTVKTNGVKPSSSIHKWLASAKPDEANDSNDERELLAMQSKTYIRKSISGNSTYNRTNTTVNTTTASVLLSNKSKVPVPTGKSVLPPPASKKPAAPEKENVQASKQSKSKKPRDEEPESIEEEKSTSSRRSRKDAAELTSKSKKPAAQEPEPVEKSTKSDKNQKSANVAIEDEIDNNIEYDVVSHDLPGSIEPVTAAVSVHVENNFEIFQDDSESVSNGSRKLKKSTQSKQLADKTNKATRASGKSSGVNEETSSNQPMSSKQAMQRDAETARKTREPKKKTVDENAYAKKIVEEATAVEDDGLRRSKRVRCDHNRQAPRYEWVEIPDFEGKPIMVHCMVGLTKKKDVFGDFVREELSKQKQRAGGATKKRKRPRSSSRSASPVKRSTKTKAVKAAPAPAPVVKEKMSSKEEKRSKSKRPVVEPEINNNQEVHNEIHYNRARIMTCDDSVEPQPLDNDNYAAVTDNNANNTNENSVSLEVHVRTSKETQASNKPSSQAAATSSGSQVPTEQISLTDIMLTEENANEANTSTECVYVKDVAQSDANKLMPAYLYCFGKLNSERKFQECSPGVYVSVINRWQGVLKIEAGACTRTHTHGDTDVCYTMQQGQSCVFSVNGLLSKHVSGDIINVHKSKFFFKFIYLT